MFIDSAQISIAGTPGRIEVQPSQLFRYTHHTQQKREETKKNTREAKNQARLGKPLSSPYNNYQRGDRT